MLKILGTSKTSISTVSTTSTAKLLTSSTTKTEELSSSSPFLEKEKEMLKLRLHYYLKDL